MKPYWWKATVLLASTMLAVTILSSWSGEPVYQGELLSFWVAELKNVNPARQELARDALHEIAVPAVPFLLQMARSEGSAFKRCYREAWYRLPGSIQRYLKEPDSEDAALSRISHALHELGPAAGSALIKALEDKNATVRFVAGASFPYGHDTPMAVLWDIRLLQTAEYDLKQYAAGALGTLGAKAKPAIPALVEVAQHDETDYVRETAARSLAMLSAEATCAVPGLKKCLHDRSAAVRLWSAIALWRINRDPNAISVLMSDLKNASAEDGTCHAAIQTLGQAGDLAKPAVPEIRRIMLQFDSERLLPEGGAALIQTARESLCLIDPVEMFVP